MYHFRLNTATMAVHQRSGEPHGSAVMIPAGSEIVSQERVDFRPGFDRSRLVEVRWAGRTVSMFLLDLMERGERVDRASRA
jgi:hypothetical protein